MARNPNFEHMLEANTKVGGKPKLDHLRIEEAENGGHIVEHHFDSKAPETHVFAEPSGHKPKLPEGHVLHHVAKHMNIPHEVLKSGHSVEEDADGAAGAAY